MSDFIIQLNPIHSMSFNPTYTGAVKCDDCNLYGLSGLLPPIQPCYAALAAFVIL